METFAEGLATRVAFELPQRIMWEQLDDFILVSDDEIRAAIVTHDRDHAQPRRGGRRGAARGGAEPARAARGQAGGAHLQRRQHQPGAARRACSRAAVVSARAGEAPTRLVSILGGVVGGIYVAFGVGEVATHLDEPASLVFWMPVAAGAAARSCSTASSAGRRSRPGSSSRARCSASLGDGLDAVVPVLAIVLVVLTIRNAQRAPAALVKITGVRTFVVGNPTPGYGGRYFIFLKLETDAWSRGRSGEVYVGDRLAAARGAHGRGRRRSATSSGASRSTSRPPGATCTRPATRCVPTRRSSACSRASRWRCGTSSARRSASPSTSCSADACASGCAPTATSTPSRATRPTSTRDPDLAAQRAAEYAALGFTAIKFDPAGAVRVVRSAAAVARRSRSLRALRRADPRGRRLALRPPVRDARAVHRRGRDPPGAAARALRSALVRGADAARVARGDGARRARDVDPDRDRRAADDEVRVRARARDGRRVDPADEPRSRRRAARGQEDRRDGGVPLRADRTAPLQRARRSAPPTSSWRRARRTSSSSRASGAGTASTPSC